MPPKLYTFDETWGHFPVLMAAKWDIFGDLLGGGGDVGGVTTI